MHSKQTHTILPPSTQGNLILVRYSLGKQSLENFQIREFQSRVKRLFPRRFHGANTWPSTCFFACLKLSQSEFLMYKFSLFFRRQSCLNFMENSIYVVSVCMCQYGYHITPDQPSLEMDQHRYIDTGGAYRYPYRHTVTLDCCLDCCLNYCCLDYCCLDYCCLDYCCLGYCCLDYCCLDYCCLDYCCLDCCCLDYYVSQLV